MQDGMYLLSIEELLEDDISEALKRRFLSLLDETRLQRVQASKGKRKLAENIGAGLLMQLAVREMCEREAVVSAAVVQDEGAPAADVPTAVVPGDYESESEVPCCVDDIFKFTLYELLNTLDKYESIPLPLEYTYTEQGKPFLKNYPYYFNLSHSGNYVFCAISREVIGADIQWMKPQAEERIIKRFFTEEEKAAWEDCNSPEERRSFFYRLWARKEAFGKLTGEGISAVLRRQNRVYDPKCGAETAVAVKADGKQVIFKDYELDNYRISICKWK